MGRYIPPFAPLRPSNLSRSTGPSSPASPLSPKPPRLTHKKATSISNRSPNTQAAQANLAEYIPVNEPMPWLWVCHKCNTRYPLGATRRCLYDGHHFCGGTTTNPITGRTKRHRACGSEFDYVGWEELGYWREKLEQAADPTKPISHTKRNCAAQCIYPSACHWRAKEAKAREQRAMQEQKAREQRAAQQEAAKKASFAFLDASCFEQDPLYCPKKSGGGGEEKSKAAAAAAAPPPTGETRKKTGNYFKGLVRAAEKGTSSISTLLNPTTTTASPNEHPRQELPPSLRIVDPTKAAQDHDTATTTNATESPTADTSTNKIPSPSGFTSLEPQDTTDIEMPDLIPSPTIPSPTPSSSSSSTSSPSSSPSTSPLPSPISPLTNPMTTTLSRHPSLAFSTDGRETDDGAAVISPMSPPDWGWLDGASKELGVEIVGEDGDGDGNGGGMLARRESAPAGGYQMEMEIDEDDDEDKEREESMEEWQRGVDEVERRLSV